TGLVTHRAIEAAAHPLQGEGHGILLRFAGGGASARCGRSRSGRGGGRRRGVAAAAAVHRPGEGGGAGPGPVVMCLIRCPERGSSCRRAGRSPWGGVGERRRPVAAGSRWVATGER